MKQKRNYKITLKIPQQSKKIALLILTGVAVLLILLAAIMHYNKWDIAYGLSCNIAATCITVLILAWVYSIVGGEPLQQEINNLKRVGQQNTEEIKNQISTFKQIIKVTKSGLDAGLIEVIPERQESARDKWHEFISSNEFFPEKVDVLGKVMKRVISSLTNKREREKLINFIKKGCNIRILILDPEGDAAKKRMMHDPGEIGRGILPVDNLKDAIAEIKEQIKGTKGSFMFKCYDITPYCQILRIGEQMLVTNYLYKISGRYCPTSFLQENPSGKLFNIYMDNFESILKSDKVRDIYDILDS